MSIAPLSPVARSSSFNQYANPQGIVPPENPEFSRQPGSPEEHKERGDESSAQNRESPLNNRVEQTIATHRDVVAADKARREEKNRAMSKGEFGGIYFKDPEVDAPRYILCDLWNVNKYPMSSELRQKWTEKLLEIMSPGEISGAIETDMLYMACDYSLA